MSRRMRCAWVTSASAVAGAMLFPRRAGTPSVRVESSSGALGDDRSTAGPRRSAAGQDRRLAPEAPDGAVDAEEELPQPLRDRGEALERTRPVTSSEHHD